MKEVTCVEFAFFDDKKKKKKALEYLEFWKENLLHRYRMEKPEAKMTSEEFYEKADHFLSMIRIEFEDSN